MADEHVDKKAADGHVQHIMMRVALNMMKTGHPFHHQTASGPIVDDDPMLREMMRQLPPELLLPIPAPLKDAPRAVPIIEDYYQTAPGKKWMRKWLSQQEGLQRLAQRQLITDGGEIAE